MMANQLPTSLQLTALEQGTLAHLTRMELSAMEFWKDAFRTRGIACPPSRVLMMVPQSGTAGTYRLEWHPKRLGRAAIAQGAAYRDFARKKDKEFQARQTNY